MAASIQHHEPSAANPSVHASGFVRIGSEHLDGVNGSVAVVRMNVLVSIPSCQFVGCIPEHALGGSTDELHRSTGVEHDRDLVRLRDEPPVQLVFVPCSLRL
jgi:hypothetical protein